MNWRDEIRRILGHDPIDAAAVRRAATRSDRPRPAGRLGRFDPGALTITPEFRRVLELLEAGVPLVFVSGRAGTGKTTLVRLIVGAATRTRRLAVVAPTGVAALQVGGQTIHSFFHLPPRVVDHRDIARLPDRQLYRYLELLVIDEISMVRADVLDAIDRFLRVNRDDDRPFGGVQVMMVGDLFQLPPVVEREEDAVLRERGYDSEYFFSAHALDGVALAPVELTRTFRQEDPEFIAWLNHLRVGERVSEIVARINAACHRPVEGDWGVTLTCTNRTADRINQERLASLPGRPVPIEALVSGEIDPGRERMPAPAVLEIKPGARVMFTRNDDARRWVNGTVGTVESVGSDVLRIEIGDGETTRVHDVARTTWEKYRYVFDPKTKQIDPVVVGRYTQFPVMLAWAITIHKSQGRTLDRVLIDLERGAFAPGQAYVALSRCRRLDDIRLRRPLRVGDVKTDARIVRFYRELRRLTAGG